VTEFTGCRYFDAIYPGAFETSDVKQSRIVAERYAIGARQANGDHRKLAAVRVYPSHATSIVLGHVNITVRANV